MGLRTDSSSEWNFTLRSPIICARNLQGKTPAGKSDAHMNTHCALRRPVWRSKGDVGLITLLLWADSNQGQMDRDLLKQITCLRWGRACDTLLDLCPCLVRTSHSLIYSFTPTGICLCCSFDKIFCLASKLHVTLTCTHMQNIIIWCIPHGHCCLFSFLPLASSLSLALQSANNLNGSAFESNYHQLNDNLKMGYSLPPHPQDSLAVCWRWKVRNRWKTREDDTLCVSGIVLSRHITRVGWERSAVC